MKKLWLIPAALSAALGVLFVFGYSPMRFSGYLCFAAAALFLLWGALSARREKRWCCVVRRILGICIVAGLFVFAVLEYQIVRCACADSHREASAVVVLGAGVNGTEPSLSLLVRLRAALDYVSDKPEIPIVVTGSQGPGEEISEAQCMAQWLIKNGIAPGRIILEEQADNTEENIVFSRRLIAGHGIAADEPVAVVTADYHLFRAGIYWGRETMIPVAASMPQQFWPLSINYYIREAFAVAKLLVFG